MNSEIGAIVWHDLTVPNAVEVRDFYQAVIGWEAAPVSMGDYDDYSMLLPGGADAAGGVCHARGQNAGLPPQWLIYVRVADLDASLAACTARGGELVVPARALGEARFAVVRDPAGAVCGLWQDPVS